MIKSSNAVKIPRIKDFSYLSIFIWGFVFFILLMMRDSYSVGINKYIFFGIICICALYMKTNHLIYLFCFLFPLYVGLPGNYMTLVLIVRLSIEIRQFRASSFILSIVLAVFTFAQNLATGASGIVPMMFVVGIILILVLFTLKKDLEVLPMILMYSAGVAALGFIMLVSTLQVYDFADLMSSSFRLGSGNVDYVDEGTMNVSADPNFYGMFSIASISIAFPFIFQPKTKAIIKVFLSVFLFTQLVICLIGLSRTFIIVFIAWAFIYMLTQKNFKSAIFTGIAIIAILIFLVVCMPNVLEAALSRFKDSDMATANGRITLIQDFWKKWSGSIITMLFGVGLYNCNVHCMPLQFLFGGGLIMFVLIIVLIISYRSDKPSRKLSDFLPFVATFIMMCTVPAAGLFNYMFPLILIGLCMPNIRGQGEMRNIDE